MTAWDRLTRMEQSLLLGFLPLLGATAHAGAAVAAVLILLAAAGLVRLAARRMPDRFALSTHQAVLAAVGFSTAYAVTAAAPFLMPVPADLTPWLLATGLTPVVFLGAYTRGTQARRDGHLGRVCAGVLLFACIREPLGSGTLFGRFLWPHGGIPLALLATSAGALILPATVTLLASLHAARTPSPEAVP